MYLSILQCFPTCSICAANICTDVLSTWRLIHRSVGLNWHSSMSRIYHLIPIPDGPICIHSLFFKRAATYPLWGADWYRSWISQYYFVYCWLPSRWLRRKRQCPRHDNKSTCESKIRAASKMLHEQGQLTGHGAACTPLVAVAQLCPSVGSATIWLGIHTYSSLVNCPHQMWPLPSQAAFVFGRWVPSVWHLWFVGL